LQIPSFSINLSILLIQLTLQLICMGLILEYISIQSIIVSREMVDRFLLGLQLICHQTLRIWWLHQTVFFTRQVINLLLKAILHLLKTLTFLERSWSLFWKLLILLIGISLEHLLAFSKLLDVLTAFVQFLLEAVALLFVVVDFFNATLKLFFVQLTLTLNLWDVFLLLNHKLRLDILRRQWWSSIIHIHSEASRPLFLEEISHLFPQFLILCLLMSEFLLENFSLLCFEHEAFFSEGIVLLLALELQQLESFLSLVGSSLGMG
jgi:hypothetical protein